MRTKAEIDAILKDVRARLDAKRQSKGIELEVPQDGYVEDDPYLSVIVSPKGQGIRAYDYVETLSEVERELKDDGTSNVLLVPAIAD